MSVLEDFSPDIGVKTGDFVTDEKPVGTGNLNIASQLAGNAAAMTVDGDPIGNYQSVMAEVADKGTSPTLDLMLKQFNERQNEQARNTFRELMLDPSFDTDDKLGIIGLFQEKSNVSVDIRDAISEEAIRSDEVETISGQEMQDRAINHFIRMNKMKREQAIAVNAKYNLEDQNVFDTILDMAEIFVPFAEANQIGDILAKAKGDESFKKELTSRLKSGVMMGSTKRELFDIVKAMPVFEREQFIGHITSVIENNENIILPDGNDLMAYTLLRQVQSLDQYSQAEEIVDNVISVLDVAGLGFALKGLLRLGRSGKATKAAGKAGDDVLEAEDLGPDSVNLDEEFPMPGGNKDNRTFEGDFEDITPSGSPQKAVEGQKKITGPTPHEKATTRHDASDVSPTSLSQNYKDTNPSKARAVHEMAMADDEAARALYGTSKENAAIHDYGHQVAVRDGTVATRTPNPGMIRGMMEFGPSDDIVEFTTRRGDIHYTDKEKEGMRSVVVHDFKHGGQIEARPELTTFHSTFKDKSTGVEIRARYGSPDGGFSNADDAIANVKYAFRDYGIKDEHLRIMARINDEYVPLTASELKALRDVNNELTKRSGAPEGSLDPIDYVVEVHFDYNFGVADFKNINKKSIDKSGKIVDPIVPSKTASAIGSIIPPFRYSTINSYLFNPDSLFEASITRPFFSGIDKAGKLEHMLNDLALEFAKPWKKLKEDRRGIIAETFKEANLEGKRYTKSQLIELKGWKKSETDLYYDWRKYWDTQFWLENRDKGQILNSKGYKFVIHGDETQLIGKPYNSNDTAHVFDLGADKATYMTPGKIKKWKEEGGQIIELLQPTQFGNDYHSFIRIPAESNSVYLRNIGLDDQVLNYRDGYYGVSYIDPIFIDEVILKTDPTNGTKQEFTRAVASAPDTVRAQDMTKQLNENAVDGRRYIYRGDKKFTRRSREEQIADDFSLSSAAGRMAQKYRGKRLENANTKAIDPAHANILDPIHAISKASRSMSERAMVMPAIRAKKMKFFQQYERVMPIVNGQRVWPTSPWQIKDKDGLLFDPEAAAARDLWVYLDNLENGFVNSAEDITKVIVNNIAHTIGHTTATVKYEGAAGTVIKEVGATVERELLKLGEISPTGLPKAIAFTLYLAINPARQFVVQSHQSVQLISRFGPHRFIGETMPDLAMLMLQTLPNDTLVEAGMKLLSVENPKLVLRTAEEYRQLYKEWQATGLLESIDKQNLVRDNLTLPLVNISKGEQIAHYVKKPVALSRQIGFDSGEIIMQMTSWLAHRSEAKRAGLDLKDPAVQENIQAQSRSFTLGMNRADDMVYNNNSAETLMHFAQVGHKAGMQMFYNRNLTPAQRTKLAAGNLALYGATVTPLAAALTALWPENKGWVEWVNFGLITTAYNGVLSFATGTDVDMDFSNLNPIDSSGTYRMLETVIRSGLGDAIAMSPSGALLFGHNPTIANTFRTAAEFLHLKDDFKDPFTFKEVAQEFALNSSGYSNFLKGYYAMVAGKKYNSMGDAVAHNLNFTESLLTIMGFPTKEEGVRRKIMESIYKGEKYTESAMKADARKWWGDFKRHLFNNDRSITEKKKTLKWLQEINRVMNDTNMAAKFHEELQALRMKDLDKEEFDVFEFILEQNGQLPQDEAYEKALPWIKDEAEMQLIIEHLMKKGDE